MYVCFSTADLLCVIQIWSSVCVPVPFCAQSYIFQTILAQWTDVLFLFVLLELIEINGKFTCRVYMPVVYVVLRGPVMP